MQRPRKSLEPTAAGDLQQDLQELDCQLHHQLHRHRHVRRRLAASHQAELDPDRVNRHVPELPVGVRVPLHHPLVRQRLVHRGHVREEPSDVENLQAGAEGGSGQPFLIGAQLDRLSFAGLEPTDLATTKGFKP